MKALTFTYDVAIAAIMILLIAIIIYSNIPFSSSNYELVNILLLAEDAAKIYINKNDCNELNNIIPSSYNYVLYLNDQIKCSRGLIQGDIGVVVTMPVSYELNNPIKQNSPYYYKSCNNKVNNTPVYRCAIYSDYSLDEILNNYDMFFRFGYVKVVVVR